MIIKQTACDHCGKVIDPMKDYEGLDITLNHVSIKGDLCGTCFNGLVKSIKDYMNTAKTAQKAPKE